ncbi:MAG: biotin transporter BioY [Candidatus Acidiferrales bacterium]
MAHARVLADRLIPGEGLAWDAARVVAANLLMVACAYIAIPLPWTAVPLTMQTFGVAFIAVLLGARRSALVMALYLLEGAMGLPVFQPFGAPGVLRLFGPTAGYLWSYPLAAFVTGWLVECCARSSLLRLGGALLAGQIVIFAGGAAWLALGMGQGWAAAFWGGVAPFVLGDIVKMALVIAAVRGVELTRRAT